MTPLTCEEVREHIELYAAGETEAATRAAVDGHVAGCTQCAQALREAEEVVGLVTLRLREQQNLDRLRQGLRAEERKRARPVILFSLRRFAALAAMLLVFVGMLTLLGRFHPQRPDDGPPVAILWQTDDAKVLRTAPNRLDVTSGQVHLQVSRGKGAAAVDLEIHTPAGVAKVGESDLFLDVRSASPARDGAQTGLLVLRGQVDFANAKGRSSAHPGEVLEASPKGPPRAKDVRSKPQERSLAAPAAADEPDWPAIYRWLTAPHPKSPSPPLRQRK